MTTGVLCPVPILQFFDNTGKPAVGGSVLTQVGGVNAATYSDVNLTTPLPNPIPLNSRGEASTAAGATAQVFLTPNTVYVFTISDAAGNVLDTPQYVDGIQLQITQALIGAALYPQTGAEITASITPTNYAYPGGDLRRYGAVAAGNVSAALASACAQAQESNGSPVYIPSALGTGCTVTAGVTIATPITIYGDGFYNSILTATSDITVFTLTDDTSPGCVLRDFQLVGIGNQTAVITGYIVGTSLTVSSVVSGMIATGQTIRGIGTTNAATTGTTAFGLNIVSGAGAAWVVSASGNVYTAGSPGTFYLGPANPAILLTSSAYNQFHRLKISGFGYGVALETGANASFLNSFYHCLLISNSMANAYLQSQSHQTTFANCTLGGGFVGWGVYSTDSSGITIYGSDCEGTAQVGIELDNAAATGNGAHFISGMDFEGNKDVGGNIRIGNTAVVYGVTVQSCTFSFGGTGDNYAINPVTCTGLAVIGCNAPSGYGTTIINTSGTLSNLTLLGCRNMTTSGAPSGGNQVTYNGGVFVGSGIAGLGYQPGNGVGGAVAQLTSRTTGVTLNTLSGGITLFSTAGSTAASTFTVSCSAVSVVDSITLSQQGGTNLYFLASRAAAGSFNVSLFTQGTATDSPVINYSIIKGAAS
jgi:hypothetical protein